MIIRHDVFFVIDEIIKQECYWFSEYIINTLGYI